MDEVTKEFLKDILDYFEANIYCDNGGSLYTCVDNGEKVRCYPCGLAADLTRIINLMD